MSVKFCQVLNLESPSDKMKIKPAIHLISAIVLAHLYTRAPVLCNPIPFDHQSTTPLIAMASMPIPAPMMMGPQFDPYSAMASSQYMLAQPPFLPMPPFETQHRRSNSGSNRAGGRGGGGGKELTDEQKAMADLPVSFIEPEGPSTITERISDSFSALGEGVKNHFKSLTENFSDTIEDIRDAWRVSDNSKKRG